MRHCYEPSLNEVPLILMFSTDQPRVSLSCVSDKVLVISNSICKLVDNQSQTHLIAKM